MPRSLYASLALGLTVILILFGSAYLAITLVTTRLHIEELQQGLHRHLAAQLVGEGLLAVDGKIDEAALEDIFHDLMVINPAIEVYLLDLEGRIVRYNAPGPLPLTRVRLEPIRRFLNEPAGRIVRGDDPRHAGREKVFSVAPMMVGNDYWGYLYVILGGDAYASVAAMLQDSYILRLGLAGLAVVLAVALVAGLLLFGVLTRRLRRLSDAVEAFTARDCRGTLEAETGGRDEIARLGASASRMAERIGELLARLEKNDNLRREMVAGVSHDLRTPLASLKGYLETLVMKEGSLSARQQRSHVETALRHADRLSRLVDDLFELAKLDAQFESPRAEPFCLAELVMDLIQKLELRAREAGVRIEAQIPQHLPFVNGEIGLIERALENLLDNALRHTPAGGNVTVRARLEGEDAVRIAVEDTGRGIDPEQLPRVFDAFFRAAPAREGEGGGAGLGLAITRRILELHGRDVSARSTPGRGSTFFFSLEAATS
ncbi:MAG: ATP-binding protein [Acidobacteriota bacterium]|nr:ATP-binding protein [Acidobacteriota bacterium]